MREPRTTGENVTLKGIGVSPGIAVAPAVLLVARDARPEPRTIADDQIDHEICRFEDALIETRRQLRVIQHDLEQQSAVADASIFDAHLMVLDDRAFIEETIAETRRRKLNIETAVTDVANRYANMLAGMKDEYLRERVNDIRDVARRVVRNLLGEKGSTLAELSEKSIVVSADLAPSETAGLRREVVVGFATDLGSITSHTAVMARALRIPAIVGLHDITRRLSSGDQILIDGNKGDLIINPTEAQLQAYGKVVATRRGIERRLDHLRDLPAVTRDGHRIVLACNTEGQDELDAVRESGGEGVGLFRSEYLYLRRDRVISEEEQTEAYTGIARALAPQSVIIRTLDLGGDKFMTGASQQKEANPFLGCRSIRYSLQHPEVFKAQLRAILRASAAGNVRIMYPMICKVEEIIRANELLAEARQELARDGVAFDPEIQVGAMIEIPSAALVADTLAQHVKFFSLGTNDLVQYTLAVDRINERVAYLYEPTHPAILQLIRGTVEAGHRHGLWVGVCGEMAGDPTMTPLLLGLGVDELSMAPAAVPMVKSVVRSLEFTAARELAAGALLCSGGAEVVERCRRLLGELTPDLVQLM